MTDVQHPLIGSPQDDGRLTLIGKGVDSKSTVSSRTCGFESRTLRSLQWWQIYAFPATEKQKPRNRRYRGLGRPESLRITFAFYSSKRFGMGEMKRANAREAEERQRDRFASTLVLRVVRPPISTRCLGSQVVSRGFASSKRSFPKILDALEP